MNHMHARYLFTGLWIYLMMVLPVAGQDSDVPDPGTVILQTVPDVRQSTEYSCGASSLQAVLAYWGRDVREDTLIGELNSSPEVGTPPGNILDIASAYGLSASMKEDMTVDDLRSLTQNGTPVIVAVQAWNGWYDSDGNWVTDIPDNWEDVWEDGHYMVVIGVDSRNVYFEDPSLIGTRGCIPIDEFVSRWHDYETNPGDDDSKVTYSHLGILITGDTPAPFPAYTRVT